MVSPATLPEASPTHDGAARAARAVRIAYVDPQSYHGLAKYDVGYLRGLRDAGFDGELLFYCSTLFDGQAPERAVLRRIFAYNRKPSSARKGFSYLRSMLRLVLEAVSAPAKVYHFQWFKLPPADYLFVLALTKLVGARVVMTAHNVVPHGREDEPNRWLGRLYRAVDSIVVHNEKTAREIAERFSVDASRISVLRHGPIKIEPRGRPRHRKRIERFAASHDLRFLFVGRGSRYKGLDLLLEAWGRAVDTAPGKPGLIVIGRVDDELKDLAVNAAREHESVLLIDDYVPEADLYHALCNADVAVLPHRHVSQSGVLLAVLGRRMPVLVSALPGLVEPFESGSVGWQFDGTAAGLADALRFLAAHPDRVAAVRADETAWQAVEEAYAWRRIGARAHEVYRDLIGR